MMMKFRNRFAFYLLAVGSACGLGNIWRFPYVAGENGGGAFILLYLLLAFTVGISILIAELMLGRFSEASLLKISSRVNQHDKKYFKWISRFTLLITLIILSYYSVVSGWVIHYMTQFIIGLFNSNTSAYLLQLQMKTLSDNGWLQFGLASVHLLIAAFIVDQRVTQRFEKILTIVIIPLFVSLFLILLGRSLSLASTPEVLRFVFYPDFSKLNLKSLGQAIGHMCFTLSLGMGALVTFGSYFSPEDHLPRVGFRVMLIDILISLLSVLLVFPVAFSLQGKPLTDPGLLFEALPRLFLKFKYGSFFGLAFFVCLWVAALNASIGLLETLISNYSETFIKKDRKTSLWVIMSVSLGLTIIPSFSSSFLKNIKFFGQTLLENLDSFLVNFLLPLSALGMIFLFYKSLNEVNQRDNFIKEGSQSSLALINHWRFILKWLAPAIIVIALFLQVWSLFA